MRPFILAIGVLLLGSFARQITAQTPLQALVDGKDGPLLDGIGPADASSNPNDLRFWMGHGLRRGQINIGSRERRFNEELGQAGDYPTAILELEFDEGGAGQADDRLFVLSRLETKSTPKRVARIQMLSVDPPTDPLQLDTIDLVQEVPAGQSAAYDYDIVALDLIPEQNLLLAVGRALPLPVDPPAVTPPTQLLLMLLRHGPLTSGGPDELIKIGELRSDYLPLKAVDGVGGRSLLGLFDAEVLPVAEPSLDQVGWFARAAHFNETPDCLPCLWPPFGNLPRLLVPRCQHRLLMTRAAPSSVG